MTRPCPRGKSTAASSPTWRRLSSKPWPRIPSDRFATAGHMAEELWRFVEGRPIRSRRIPFYEQLWRWCKRNPWLAVSNIAAALLTMTLAIGSTVFAIMLKKEQRATIATLKRAEKAERATTEELGRTYLTQAQANRFSHRIGHASIAARQWPRQLVLPASWGRGPSASWS